MASDRVNRTVAIQSRDITLMSGTCAFDVIQSSILVSQRAVDEGERCKMNVFPGRPLPNSGKQTDGMISPPAFA